ncbi:MAG: hypothetical protein AAB818_02860, partial [Patescibacteria group bacterium]
MKAIYKEAHWLNLEYLFNQIIRLMVWLLSLIKKVILSLNDMPFRIFFLLLASIALFFLVLIFFKFLRLKRKMKKFSRIRFGSESNSPKERSTKWMEIKSKISSDMVEERKSAIIMADGILDEIFLGIGFNGDGLGEKLRQVEPSDFNSLQDVLSAYGVRTKIAREGADFEISQEEAEDALAKY